PMTPTTTSLFLTFFSQSLIHNTLSSNQSGQLYSQTPEMSKQLRTAINAAADGRFLFVRG
ncbi:MAG: hypothetical protein ACYTDV_15590, partial [Planctomycetota bacterium]